MMDIVDVAKKVSLFIVLLSFVIPIMPNLAIASSDEGGSDDELYICPDGSPVPPDTARYPNLSEEELEELEEAILNDPNAPNYLPKCNGTFQDCVTENGDICLAGSTEHECEW